MRKIQCKLLKTIKIKILIKKKTTKNTKKKFNFMIKVIIYVIYFLNIFIFYFNSSCTKNFT